MHSRYDEIQEILDNFKEQLPESDLSAEASENKEWPRQVILAETFIHDHLYDDRLTVGWLKEKCRINGKNFAARFRRCTGYHPKEYILHYRLKAGKRLLNQSKVSITEIALAVGFRSVSSFCKTFKKREDLRPSEWQSKNQTQNKIQDIFQDRIQARK
jgi:AraC-like DNA-binding protein